MVLEDKSIIFAYLNEITDYDTSVDDDNIGFQIVEFIRKDITRAISDSGFYCNAFTPIFVSHTNTDVVKLKFILYTTYRGNLIISLPEDNFATLHKVIDEQLKFYLTGKPKTTGGVIR